MQISFRFQKIDRSFDFLIWLQLCLWVRACVCVRLCMCVYVWLRVISAFSSMSMLSTNNVLFPVYISLILFFGHPPTHTHTCTHTLTHTHLYIYVYIDMTCVERCANYRHTRRPPGVMAIVLNTWAPTSSERSSCAKRSATCSCTTTKKSYGCSKVSTATDMAYAKLTLNANWMYYYLNSKCQEIPISKQKRSKSKKKEKKATKI